MTNAATASGRLTAGPQPAGPDTARTTWPRMALLGGVLLALGLVALLWDDGDRVLLAGLGAVAVVRGAGTLRDVRAGGRSRAAATAGALAVWLGLVAAAVALLSGPATAWVLVAGLVLAVPALLLVAGVGWGGAGAAGVAVLAGAALLGVLGGGTTLLGVGTAVVAVGVATLGLVNLLGAVGMWRIARRPAPEPVGGCGACACGAGGCGS
ncbi:MAG TPA: hypothetical protein VGO95_02230 [Modestobacter sp.]|nr:hypothetical protein [Modestobacter sp.]